MDKAKRQPVADLQQVVGKISDMMAKGREGIDRMVLAAKDEEIKLLREQVTGLRAALGRVPTVACCYYNTGFCHRRPGKYVKCIQTCADWLPVRRWMPEATD